ncbi:MAG: enoyl-[acyl-carrier-protein] reductase, partial [Chlamydiia bacterium]
MLAIDLQDRLVFIAGIADDQGFGWACARACAEAGARVIAGTWVPMVRLFEEQLASGRFLESQRLPSGKLLTFEAILPMDARYDQPDQVPDEVRQHKRYAGYEGYTLQEVAQKLRQLGPLGGVIHSLAMAPEIRRPLLQTSRSGYLEALSTSSYSWVSLVQHLGPLMTAGSSFITLTYRASQQVIPGYGGGMSSAKAALESDTRTLAWEAGRAWGLRVNAVSPGPWPSRAARAIGPIDAMITASQEAAPLRRPLQPADVGSVVAFLLSPLAMGITGSVIMVDNGLHIMGAGLPTQ